ncbi:Aa-trans domain-containing protein [Aphelenchoides besseyi]|nr:Aa-trans domain-containing protein [Aphelenchoides besseyi]KAI6201114.1 Aa-trans domain-containing protein [Aphelenchoides besseyi]
MSENRELSPTVEIETMNHSVDRPMGDPVIAPGVQETHNEESHLFAPRPATASSLTSEQAFMSMLKGMLGVGVLSLPLAFKRAGLYVSDDLNRSIIDHLAWAHSVDFDLHRVLKMHANDRVCCSFRLLSKWT